jgi:hypothetical protein
VRHKYELFTLTKKTPLCAFPKEVTVERVRGNIVICHLEVTFLGESWSIQAVKILAVRFGDVAAC